VFAVRGQHRFAPWLAASALAHLLGAAGLLVLRPLPSPIPEPLRVVRVDLLGPAVAPGPAAAAPEVAVPPPRPAPAPRAVPAKPAAPRAVAPRLAAPEAAPAPAPSVAEAAASAVGSGGGGGANATGSLAAVSAAPPVGGAGGGADALEAYIARLQRAIDAHKSYPPMARRRGIEGVVTVRLAIDAQGGLASAALVGRPPEILARSTREAVDRAGPFPPPPAGPLQVEFPVRYEIVE
jgi:protein TonB